MKLTATDRATDVFKAWADSPNPYAASNDILNAFR